MAGFSKSLQAARHLFVWIVVVADRSHYGWFIRQIALWGVRFSGAVDTITWACVWFCDHRYCCNTRLRAYAIECKNALNLSIGMPQSVCHILSVAIQQHVVSNQW